MKYPNASRPVVLLQPHHGLRCFLQSLIQETDGLHLAAHAADSLTARQTLAGIDNPIIVADPWLPPCSVFDLCKNLGPHQLILYSSGEMADVTLSWAARYRSGVVTGADPVDEVRAALHASLSGIPYYSSSLRNRHTLSGVGSTPFESKVLTILAEMPANRLAILLLSAQGYRVKEIADLLDVTAKSVDSQLYRVRKSLGVHDRVELTMLCLREGLIRIPGLEERMQGLCIDCARPQTSSIGQALLCEFIESEVLCDEKTPTNACA
ncbi:MAG: response regulator transcription factor [Planctomycetales bacterium]|jgi:two-component system invasion response regulator UvrY